MATETTSESTPEPDALSPADHIALSGRTMARGTVAAGMDSGPDTPLAARAEADAAILSSWHQPLARAQPRSTYVIQGGPASPPFPPPVHVDVPITGVEVPTEVGAPSVIVNRVIAAESGQYNIRGNAPDLIVKRSIGRAGGRNHAAVQLTALSFLTTVLLKLETMRTERLNSEDAAIFESLKIDIEAFLAANATSDETSTAKATNAIAKGLRRYWESEAESISGKMLNTTLFVAGVSFCAAAGAFGVSDASIVTVGALVGGKNVVDALTALAKLLPRDD